MNAKPELLERQAALWLHLAGARGILEGQGSASATDAAQRAFEIGAHIKGRSFYGAVAVQASMLCAHGRIDEADVIAQGLREQYRNSGDFDCGVASDFASVVVAGLRGETDLQIEIGRHMMDTFPAPETVTDPAFMVTRVLEDFVTWTDSSKIRRKIQSYHNMVDDYDLL